MNRPSQLLPINAVRAYSHTAAQLRKRYGLCMTPKEYLDTCQAIYSGFNYLEREHAGESRWRVKSRFRGRSVIFIYDLEDRLIVTALPRQTERTGTGYFMTPNGHRRKARHRCKCNKKSKYPPHWEELD